MISLRRRLNNGLAAILIAVFTLQWFAADWVIRRVAENEMLTRLSHDSDSLLDTLTHGGEGNIDIDRSRVPLVYDQAWSGHYFAIQVDGGTPLQSASLQGQRLAIRDVAAGQSRHYHLPGPQDQPLLALASRVQKNGHDIALTVAEDLTEIGREIRQIRQIYLLLTLMTLTLAVALQSWDVKRALRPLRRIETELGDIADGRQQQITARVPVEIESLVREVNRLIVLIERRLQQSRTAIGNLAHALKTPLAVLVRAAEHPGLEDRAELKTLLQTQTHAIQERLSRELKRARLAGQSLAGDAFDPRAEVDALVGLLRNIYSEKNLTFEVRAPDKPIPYDRQDLLEIVGNLADNACKWAESTVRITLSYDRRKLYISVEDDGPGCGESNLEQLAKRGVRLDESVQGHGLGLAIVRDIAEFYNGSLRLSASRGLGGLRAEVTF